MLSDFRASIRGRKKRGGAHGAVLEMVEKWIDWTGRGDQIREESSMLGKELAKCRREMQKMRRLKRRGLGDWVLKHDQEDESQTLLGTEGESGRRQGTHTGQDFECSIIDFYANRMSTASPIHRVRTADGLHEAFSESIRRDPVNGKFERAGPGAQGLHRTTFYTESVYSTHSSGCLAASYQSLLPTPPHVHEEEADWDSESVDLSSLPPQHPLFDFF